MEELQSLLGCGRPWAEQRAAIALDLEEQYRAGELHPDEYRELLEDLIRTDVLDSEADDLQTKQILVYGITQALSYIG